MIFFHCYHPSESEICQLADIQESIQRMREGELVRRGFGACASAIFILMVLLFSILYLWCLCDLILRVLDIMTMMKMTNNNR